jgi:hypothetical protein
LLPRVLVLDRQEHPWKSGEVITLNTLTPSNAPPHSLAK